MTDLDKAEQFSRDTESITFPKLDDREIAMLEPLGGRDATPVFAGDVRLIYGTFRPEKGQYWGRLSLPIVSSRSNRK